MDYVSALVPPIVMAAFFIALVVTIVKSQGGANKAKEDAAVDAVLASAEAARQPGSNPGRKPRGRAYGLRAVRPILLPDAGSSRVAGRIVGQFRTTRTIVLLCLAPWENSKTQ